jgi:F0F1-type ATP synthase assembly protein I
MGPERRPEGDGGDGYDYVSLGFAFAAGVVLFMAGGWALDRWLGITPILTITGTLAGTALSTFWVYMKIRADTERRDELKRRDRRR